MIFTAPFLDETEKSTREVIIFVLIEHQSSVDPIMPFRVLYYMVMLWETQRRKWESQKKPPGEWKFSPILPVLFYTGDQRWELPLGMKHLVDLPSTLERFIPEPNMLFLNLKAISPEQLVKEDHPFEWVLRVIQKERSTEEEFREALQATIRRLELMPPAERANWEKLIYFLLAFIKHRRDATEHDDLFRVIKENITDKSRREEVESMGKTMAQLLIEEGEERGEARGEVRGEVRGKAEFLIRFLYRKFELVPEDIIEKINSIYHIDQLDALLDCAIAAKTIDDVKKGLDGQA